MIYKCTCRPNYVWIPLLALILFYDFYNRPTRKVNDLIYVAIRKAHNGSNNLFWQYNNSVETWCFSSYCSGSKLLVPRVNTSKPRLCSAVHSQLLLLPSGLFTSRTDSIVTKELHDFSLQTVWNLKPWLDWDRLWVDFLRGHYEIFQMNEWINAGRGGGCREWLSSDYTIGAAGDSGGNTLRWR